MPSDNRVVNRTTEKKDTAQNFLTDTLNRNGDHHVVVGDLNARISRWDTKTKEIGVAVSNAAYKTHKAYVVAAKEPSYYRTVKHKGGTNSTQKSNPDLAIVRTHEATAYIDEKDWVAVSDHRPVVLFIKAEVKLKHSKRRVAMSLFFSKEAVKESVAHYEDEIDTTLRNLEDCKTGKTEKEIQAVYRNIEIYITDPWIRIINKGPPKKPL